MKTVGIIAEYNPFHTGHAYHIRKAKELSGADHVVLVMSPDFVQRGEPALFNKYVRTEMALRCGADLVLELPVCYASGSAEYFAEGAVSLLDSLGVIDVLCFGAETDDKELFLQTAQILAEEPEEYQKALRQGIKQGLTFPQARSAALSMFSLSGTEECHKLSSFVETPNNILGIEYCKALHKLGSSIQPLPIKRTGSDYNSSLLDGRFCSATAIRETISKIGSDKEISEKTTYYIPESCHDLFYKNCQIPVYAKDLSTCLYMKLLEYNKDSLTDILDISSDLADRIMKLRFQFIGKEYSEIISILKTKQITESRIRRALLHLLLGIRTDEVERFRQEGAIFYARMLGFQKHTAQSLLHKIKENGRVPLLSKTAAAAKLLEGTALKMWELDLRASHFYRMVTSTKYNILFETEYERSPVMYPGVYQ